jgi:hypothetical protein
MFCKDPPSLCGWHAGRCETRGTGRCSSVKLVLEAVVLWHLAHCSFSKLTLLFYNSPNIVSIVDVKRSFPSSVIVLFIQHCCFYLKRSSHKVVVFYDIERAKASIILQGSSSAPILVPVSSSNHHVELNMRSQSKNARYALMTLANEMSDKHKITEPVLRKYFKGIIHALEFCNILESVILFELFITWLLVLCSNCSLWCW